MRAAGGRRGDGDGGGGGGGCGRGGGGGVGVFSRDVKPSRSLPSVSWNHFVFCADWA